MFNLNKFNTQKEIWDEPSLVDEVEDTKNYYGMFPKFWYNKPSEKTMEELEKMFKENQRMVPHLDIYRTLKTINILGTCTYKSKQVLVRGSGSSIEVDGTAPTDP